MTPLEEEALVKQLKEVRETMKQEAGHPKEGGEQIGAANAVGHGLGVDGMGRKKDRGQERRRPS